MAFVVGKLKMGGCLSPATAARMMPPPSTGRFLHPPPSAVASRAAMHTRSTPRPQQRKKRRRAAQQGHVLLTQESPASESPCRANLQGEYAVPHHMQKCLDAQHLHLLWHIVLGMLCNITLKHALRHDI